MTSATPTRRSRLSEQPATPTTTLAPASRTLWTTGSSDCLIVRVDASIAVIIGAAVGAVGGLGGGAVSVMGQARSQRSQHANERTR